MVELKDEEFVVGLCSIDEMCEFWMFYWIDCFGVGVFVEMVVICVVEDGVLGVVVLISC